MKNIIMACLQVIIGIVFEFIGLLYNNPMALIIGIFIASSSAVWFLEG